MSRGVGVLQQRLLAQLEAAEGKIQSASELIAAILLEDHPEGEIAALTAARENVASAVRRGLRSLQRHKLVHRVHGSRYPEGHSVYRFGEPEPTARTITIIRGVEKPLLPPTLPAYTHGEDGELQRVDHPTGFPVLPAKPPRRRK